MDQFAKLITVTTEPVGAVVENSKLLAHARLATEDDNDWFADALSSVTQQVEHIANISLLKRTLTIKYDTLDDELILPSSPLYSLDSVKYYDSNQVEQTLASTIYEVGYKNRIPRIRRKYNQTWPVVLGHPDSVTVVAKFGHATAEDVPESIKHAIRLLVTAYWENRGEFVSQENEFKLLPMGVQHLLAPYCVKAYL